MMDGFWAVKPVLGSYAQGYAHPTPIINRRDTGIDPDSLPDVRHREIASESGLKRPTIVAPILAPEPATGPPPAFEANVLEVAARRRHDNHNDEKAAPAERRATSQDAARQRLSISPANVDVRAEGDGSTKRLDLTV